MDCSKCGSEFPRLNKRKKYCSRTCQQKAYLNRKFEIFAKAKYGNKVKIEEVRPDVVEEDDYQLGERYQDEYVRPVFKPITMKKVKAKTKEELKALAFLEAIK